MNIGVLVLAALGLSLAGSRGKEIVEDELLKRDDNWHKYDYLFQKHGKLQGVDWRILKAIALNESALGAARSVKRGLEMPSDVQGSKSSDGKSWGLMQLTIPTARDYDIHADAVALNNPDYSVDLAARFVRDLQKQFNNYDDDRRLEWIVKSYNQGAGNTRKEMRGEIRGYAEVYWERFQRNFELVKKG